MSGPLDYLVAAASYRYSYIEEKDFSFPSSAMELARELGDYYQANVDVGVAERVIQEMSRLGILSYSQDKYAGPEISANSENIDSKYEEMSLKDPQIFRPLSLGTREFFIRVLANPVFWTDVNEQLVHEAVGDHTKDIIPAADRFVTILHNSDEGKLIDASLDMVINDLNHNNEIADSAGSDRPRFIAEAKASREVLRGETIRRSALIEVVWKFFRELLGRFKQKASDWGIEKVISLLDQMLDLIK